MDSFNKLRLWRHLQNDDLKTHIMKHRVTKETSEVGMQLLCMTLSLPWEKEACKFTE